MLRVEGNALAGAAKLRELQVRACRRPADVFSSMQTHFFATVPVRATDLATFEDHVSAFSVEAVSAFKAGCFEVGLVLAFDTVSARVAVDECNTPAFRRERHGGIA